MFILGTQYYRPPFPSQSRWDADFAQIKNSGLNTVQLWVLWSWVEATPGIFQFADYDRLIALAEKNDLRVVLSIIPEVQPLWIHREIPGSEMIDHRGCKVVSSNRVECHHGITPGGCTDHPEVWKRMAGFMEEVVIRYRGSKAVVGWDIWNELRWNEQSDGLVCFCNYTLQSFHAWLDKKHDGLDGLNRAWNRRYSAWDEVNPGRLPGRPYTELMAFQHFATSRANAHACVRYDCVKALDPGRPATVHAAHPCAIFGGWREAYALDRGNDWALADQLDGIGCSSFPKWGGIDDADFAVRVEFVKSAAGNKRVWLSEVQGGRAALGFDLTEAVDAPTQQRWIWNGLACGADTILFWCWRDEVFGRESGGFGIVGEDGLAEQRLEALRKTSALLTAHEALLSKYQPVRPRVGVFFSPQTYYLHWAQEGESSRAIRALEGYCRALARRSIPYTVVEEQHLNALNGLSVLFMPRTLVVDDTTAAVLARFVKSGGTLVTESECGAFNSVGLYRYPKERFTAKLAGVHEVGRRMLSQKTVSAKLDRRSVKLGVAQWFTPWTKAGGTTLAGHKDGALLLDMPCKEGRLILGGAYFGEAYRENPNAGFEDFVEWVACSSGISADFRVLSPRAGLKHFVFVKQGVSKGKRVAFVFLPGTTRTVSILFVPDYFKSGQAQDLITGERISLKKTANGQACSFKTGEVNLAILIDL